jgi:LytS/YehU family sensor histidine kinase
MYESLKQQLNPHFLFNSLTSLSSLIESEPKAASGFLDSLSKTYRYILKTRDNETVPLIDEIKFAENYVKLQTTRFEKGFIVNMNIPEEFYHRKIVPVTLQNLIENAIKHNIIDEDSPLQVDIFIKNDYLVVQNNLQKKKFVETSNKHGLVSMESLYRYLSNQPVEINESNNFFTVKIPLL